jgi:DNA-binding NtrC family response regulator
VYFLGKGGKMANINHALVICNQGEDRQKILGSLLKCSLSPICCSNVQEARKLLFHKTFRVVLCSDLLSDSDFQTILRERKKSSGHAPVIVLSHVDEWDSYLKVLAAGAFDSIVCPPNPVETERIIWSALTETMRAEKATQAMARPEPRRHEANGGQVPLLRESSAEVLTVAGRIGPGR